MNGGKRPGAGRKKGGRNRAQQKAIDVAGKVLEEIDSAKAWKELLTCDDFKVRVDVLKYLTNRVHGMPRQTQELSGPNGGPINTRGSLRIEFISPDDSDTEGV